MSPRDALSVARDAYAEARDGADALKSALADAEQSSAREAAALLRRLFDAADAEARRLFATFLAQQRRAEEWQREERRLFGTVGPGERCECGHSRMNHAGIEGDGSCGASPDGEYFCGCVLFLAAPTMVTP